MNFIGILAALRAELSKPGENLPAGLDLAETGHSRAALLLEGMLIDLLETWTF
jgi:hypothetical protein